MQKISGALVSIILTGFFWLRQQCEKVTLSSRALVALGCLALLTTTAGGVFDNVRLVALGGVVLGWMTLLVLAGDWDVE